MLFQSAGFLFVFLPLAIFCLSVLPKGIPRAIGILFFSYLFYSGNEPFFIVLLVFSSLVDYFAALRLGSAKSPASRKTWLVVSVVVNLGLLGFYKYGSMILPAAGFYQSFALPAGISFYTFQSMSYTIDVYRKKIQPERSLLGYCNYVAYLPQLIAGPIERFSDLFPQLRAYQKRESRPMWTAGLDRLALGVILKLLVADSCGHVVDTLTQHASSYTFFSSWAVAVGFGMQIFFDFAAYTHMAIGISAMLGIKLTENFLSPYQAGNIQDFWRRWHVSLTSWFRDYLYFPLGGSRAPLLRTFLNVLITFMLCGLWHGAGWNFVFWGTLHGLFVGGYMVMKRKHPGFGLPRAAGVAITFVLVHFLWVLFRISDPGQIGEIYKGMLGFSGFGLGRVCLADLIFLGVVTAVTLRAPNAAQRWPGRSGWLESAALWALALFAVLSSPQINQFIYFRF
jgi:alginate O-acetyltransferase complex protein AlgI